MNVYCWPVVQTWPEVLLGECNSQGHLQVQMQLPLLWIIKTILASSEGDNVGNEEVEYTQH